VTTATQCPLRLNIGAGDTKIEGFTPIDRKFGSEAFPLPYPDNSVEEIRASHILEHFSFGDGIKALSEWVRVLKPGGRLRVAVPDVDKVLAAKGDQNRLFYLMGGQCNADDFHRSAFDEERLCATLAQAGLERIDRWHSPNTDTAASPISLNLEGFKPSGPQEQIKIKAVMSIPRVGWNDTWGCVQEALIPFGIPLERNTGVFWGQCMQRSFEQALKTGVDWLLTIDYDSVFTAQHLDQLIGDFGSHPEIDALAALQCRRGSEFPLMTCGGAQEAEIGREPIKVTTAHFGLTLIRMDALAKVAKPWFKGEPDKDGGWGDERLDEDIWFWHQWRLAGNTVYVSPNARIGHLELMVSEFGEDMQPRHVYVGDWRKSNAKEGS
jgi:hypothetical protein